VRDRATFSKKVLQDWLPRFTDTLRLTGHHRANLSLPQSALSSEQAQEAMTPHNTPPGPLTWPHKCQLMPSLSGCD
jgi:hypothetical protein